MKTTEPNQALEPTTYLSRSVLRAAQTAPARVVAHLERSAIISQMKHILALFLIMGLRLTANEPDRQNLEFFKTREDLKNGMTALSEITLPFSFKTDGCEICACVVSYGSGRVTSELFIYSKPDDRGWFLVLHLPVQDGAFLPKMEKNGDMIIISTLSNGAETPLIEIKAEFLRKINRDPPIRKTTEPNQALEPTTLAVTLRAPSRTDRAS